MFWLWLMIWIHFFFFKLKTLFYWVKPRITDQIIFTPVSTSLCLFFPLLFSNVSAGPWRQHESWFIRAGQTEDPDQIRVRLKQRWRSDWARSCAAERKTSDGMDALCWRLHLKLNSNNGCAFSLCFSCTDTNTESVPQPRTVRLWSPGVALWSLSHFLEEVFFSEGVKSCEREMSEPEKSENIPDESAGKGKEIPNGGNPAKTKEVRHTHWCSCTDTHSVYFTWQR